MSVWNSLIKRDQEITGQDIADVQLFYQSLLALHYRNINIIYNFAQIKLVNDSTPFSSLVAVLKNDVFKHLAQ